MAFAFTWVLSTTDYNDVTHFCGWKSKLLRLFISLFYNHFFPSSFESIAIILREKFDHRKRQICIDNVIVERHIFLWFDYVTVLSRI